MPYGIRVLSLNDNLKPFLMPAIYRHFLLIFQVNLLKFISEILAQVTGRKTLSVLVNTYYNPTASEIAKMLNAA